MADHEERKPEATTFDSGIPAPGDDRSLTVGPGGPNVLHDAYVVQKMQQFNRERVVHAKGSGAHGFFEVTDDVTPYTKAAFLSGVGKRTPVFARFSSVAGEQGYSDTVRDPRGFALKFYTEEGNWDMVGNNTPVFFMRDPSKFQDFIRSQKRLPDTGLRSNDMQWDYWTLSPESAHQVAILMSDRGIPKSYRTMNGYSSHTYSWTNAGGERFWVKYHFKSAQGIDNLAPDAAAAEAGADPDFHRRDLWDAIERGDAPEWRLEVGRTLGFRRLRGPRLVVAWWRRPPQGVYARESSRCGRARRGPALRVPSLKGHRCGTRRSRSVKTLVPGSATDPTEPGLNNAAVDILSAIA